MKILMLTSLGDNDCRRLGLELGAAPEGQVVEFGQKVADELLRRGWATEAGHEPRPASRPETRAGAEPTATASGLTSPPVASPKTPTPSKTT